MPIKMDKNIKLSIVIPIHDMKGGADFLWASINALMDQSFQDFEIVITKAGKMAENTNAGIKRARGELIKVLYLDDRLAYKDALKDIVEAMEGKEWLITGCSTNFSPHYTDNIETGNNKLGSPSCLTMRNNKPLLFDEKMSWLLDCDLYKRMYEKYGAPVILEGEHVVMGIGNHQMTNILTDEEKKGEYIYLKTKNDNRNLS